MNSRQTWLKGPFFLLGTLLFAASHADTVAYNIEPGDLQPALESFIEQSGEQLIYRADEIAGASTDGLKGSYESVEALRQLLRASGLALYVDRSGAIVVHKVATEDRQAEAALYQEIAMTAVAEASAVKPTPNADTGTAEEVIDLITVTGSRIQRTGFDTSYPLVTHQPDRVRNSGVNVGDLLAQSPAFTSSSNTRNSPDAVFLNLRGLGETRTLTVVDGYRQVAGSSTSSSVDISTIPSGLIERIEVITGGAAAVYGADAVTGVVNVITRNDVDGIEVGAKAVFNDDDGTWNYNVDLIGGAPFGGGKGSIVFGVSYDKRDELLAPDHDFYGVWGRSFRQPNPEDTGPDDGIYDNILVHPFTFTVFPYEGGFFDGQDAAGNPVFLPQIYMIDNDTGVPRTPVLGIDGYGGTDFAAVQAKRERVSALMDVDYSVAPDLSFFMKNYFSYRSADVPEAPVFGVAIPIPIDNPYVTPELAQFMTDNGLASINVWRAARDQGVRVDKPTTHSFSTVTGFDGAFANDWEWKLFGQYGRYDSSNERTNTRITERYLEAVNAVVDPATGAIVCADPAATAAGCVPVNILGEQEDDPQDMSYFQHTKLDKFVNTQTIFGVQLAGSLFELPAGPLQFSAGVEHRKETLETTPDGLAQNGALTFEDASPALDEEFNVDELYLEILAPITSDASIVGAVDVEGAVRYSDYNTIGETTAWNLGLSWSPMDSLRFRASVAQSVRAPNLFELFNPGVSGLASVLDPCDLPTIDATPQREQNCRALGIPVGWEDPARNTTQGSFTGGNPGLNEEEAETYTFGVVYEPGFAPGLRVSVDWWDIELDGAVASIDSQRAADACVDSATIDNVFCTLFVRGDSVPDVVGNADEYSIRLIRIVEINVAKLRAAGLDFEAYYSMPAWRGDFIFSLLGTYLDTQEFLGDASDPLTVQKFVGDSENPRFRATMRLGYAANRYSVDLYTRYVSDAKGIAGVSDEFSDDNDIGTKVFNDLHFNMDITDSIQLHGGINNLFDTEPPVNQENIGFAAGVYDPFGRVGFVGATVSF